MLGRITIALLLTVVTGLSAQETADIEEVGLIQGTIMDTSRRNAPIPNANIKYESIKNHVTGTTTSNESGAYLIEKLPAGQYIITVSAEGYVPRPGLSTAVMAGRESVFNIPLRPKPDLLNSLIQNRIALVLFGFILGLLIGLLTALMIRRK